MSLTVSIAVAIVATAAGAYLLATSIGGGTIGALWGVVFGLVLTVTGVAIGIGVATKRADLDGD